MSTDDTSLKEPRCLRTTITWTKPR